MPQSPESPCQEGKDLIRLFPWVLTKVLLYTNTVIICAMHISQNKITEKHTTLRPVWSFKIIFYYTAQMPTMHTTGF